MRVSMDWFHDKM